MAKIARYLPILQILFSICSVHCRNSNFDTIKRMYSFQRNLNISNVINDVLMYNSSENFECLNELKTLVNDFADLDEWAIQSRYNTFFLRKKLFFFRFLFELNTMINVKRCKIKILSLFLVADAWGTFPSGIRDGNLFALGSFSQCFHIKKHGIDYKTQYCIGKLKFLPEQPIRSESLWSLYVAIPFLNDVLVLISKLTFLISVCRHSYKKRI